MAIETLGAALRHITHLFAEGVVAGHSDAQLPERFRTRADAAAFEALVGRHGPMVLSVCRGILCDPRDAEDAFQATCDLEGMTQAQAAGQLDWSERTLRNRLRKGGKGSV